MIYWYEVIYGKEQLLHYLVPAECPEKALKALGVFGLGFTARQVNWQFMSYAVGCEIPDGEMPSFWAHGCLRFCMKDRDYFLAGT